MKGQVVTLDFIAAFFIFLGIMIGFVSVWETIVDDVDESITDSEMRSQAVLSSMLFLDSVGIPSNWTTNASIPGVNAGSPNKIDPDKLSNFIGLDYNDTKQKLGIPYEIYIEVTDTDNNYFNIAGNETKFGLNTSSADEVTVVRRLATLSGNVAKITVSVWV